MGKDTKLRWGRKCRHCGSEWMPEGTPSPAQWYCPNCREERRRIAAETFDTSPLTPAELSQRYVLRGRRKAA